MKRIEITRDSWHYKLASMGGFTPGWHADQNLCAYARYFAKGLFVATFLFAVTVVFFTIVGIGLADICAYLFLGREITVFAGFLLAAAGVGIIFVSCSFISYKIGDWIEARRYAKKKEPGLLALWWEGKRHKLCFAIEIKDKE